MNSLLVLCVLSSALAAADPAPASDVHQTSLPGHTFTLPVGFEIEQVAGPPLIERPIHADFDEQGRLYVCESSGTNDPVNKQLAEKPHWIVRLEDTDGDGHFDRKVKFADQMMFPEGMLWHEGSIYVAAPPSIWKLTDTNQDGIADQREEWFKGKTLTGCANDLHGPYEGLDGWIYWCKGAFAQQSYDRPGKSPWTTRAAHIFRCRPDGTGIEAVMTGGMDNPVEVIFTPGGERIFTTTFFQHPGGGRRDGLIHAIYGGVYGKQHDVIEGHPRTGDLMPVLTHFGAAAPSGLARLESPAWGEATAGNLVAAQFNMHKVSRHALTPSGSTFASADHDLVVSDSLDFHPTDVLEDADGSLLVINTGGWYKLCCPTSQLWKPEIVGGIYRVRRTGAPAVADARGLKLDWSKPSNDELTRRLADPRPAVSKRAMRALSHLGNSALPALTKTLQSDPQADARRLAIWTASRLGTPEARAMIRQGLQDKDDTVRQAAVHSVSVARDTAAVPQLLQLLQQGSPHNARAAAEALGRLDQPEAVAPLLSVAGRDLDRILEHSVTYALIELAKPEETRAGLKSDNPRTRRAALIALDQMEEGGLAPKEVLALLTGNDSQLHETAAWILTRHPAWGADLADPLSQWIESGALAGPQSDVAVDLLARFASDATIQSLLAARLQSATKAAEKQQLLAAMARSGMKTLPTAWAAPLAAVIQGDADLAPLAIQTLRALPSGKTDATVVRAALLAAGADQQRTAATRLDALAAIPGGQASVQPEVFAFVLGNLQPDVPVSLRLAAADVLSKAQLDKSQRLALAGPLRTAGPLEIERLLAPFAKDPDAEVGRAVIAALAQSAALTALRPETLQETFKDYDPQIQEATQALHQLLAASAESRKERIEQLLKLVSQGDRNRGQVVFNSQKAACATCHAIGYLGGTVGPDLTRVGQIRSERDLAEAIIFPSASFVRSYEPITVSTTGGMVHNGLLRKDSPEEVILAINAKDTVRIPRDEIEQMVPSTVSVMPTGLDQQLSAQELADLVTFLKACK